MAVFIADEQTHPMDAERLRRLADFVLADRRVPRAMELSVLAVDRDTIAALNTHHLDGEGPTDVLAFPIDLPGESEPGQPALLGDVVLCPDIAADQAGAHGHSADAELELLLVHGILHLLGHDHAEPDERQAMFALTDRLLADFRSTGSAQGT
jgi:probable rRNA maturation factor